MDGNNLEGGVHPPAPPQPPARPTQAGVVPPPVPSLQAHVPPAPSLATEPPTPSGDRGGRSTLFKVLVGLALLSLLPVVLVIGLVVASSIGLFDSDPVESEASPQPVENPEESATPVPAPRDGVAITWDADPSSCDGNNKRSFSAALENGSPGALEVRMRILDPANNFIHQSHVYTAPSSGQVDVDLGGIPSGPSIVQIIDESNDEAIAQTSVRFEDC